MRSTCKIILITLLILTGCSNNPNEIVKIPEASGICFSKTSNTLYVASDEGTVYEISKAGKVLRKQYLGNYDLEGVACDDKNHELLFAYEGEDSVIRVNPKTLKVTSINQVRRVFQKNMILKKDKRHGLEGITQVNGTLFLSNQSHHFKPMIDPSVIVETKNINKNILPIERLLQPKHVDISGLDYHGGFLYMVSDTEDLLMKYDLKNNKEVATVKLPAYAQEGIALDNENNIYIANDNGSVLKYDHKSLGL
jgi:uncharacterized protein YjiK